MKTDDLITLMAGDNAGASLSDRRRRTLAAAGLAGAVALMAVIFFASMGARPGIGEPAILAAVLRKETVTLAMAAAGLFAAFALARPEVTQSRLWLVPAATLAVLLAWETAAIGLAGLRPRAAGTNALACLIVIPLLASLPLAALLYALRRGAPASPGLAGAAAGLGASGIGATLYALHCTDDSMFFVALWYGLATLGLVALGAVLGRRVLRW